MIFCSGKADILASPAPRRERSHNNTNTAKKQRLTQIEVFLPHNALEHWPQELVRLLSVEIAIDAAADVLCMRQ